MTNVNQLYMAVEKLRALNFGDRSKYPGHKYPGETEYQGTRKRSGLPFRSVGDLFDGFQENRAVVGKAIASATVSTVPIKGLWSTGSVDKAHVNKLLAGTSKGFKSGGQFESSVPTVLRVRGEYVVLDGHHRLAAAYARGDNKAVVRVVEGLTPRFMNRGDRPLAPFEK